MALRVPTATAGDFLELLWNARNLSEVRLDPDRALARIRGSLEREDHPAAWALLYAELAQLGPVLTYLRYLSPMERSSFIDPQLLLRYAGELNGLAGLAAAREGRWRAAREFCLCGLAADPASKTLRNALHDLSADGSQIEERSRRPVTVQADDASQVARDQRQMEADLAAAGIDDMGVVVLKTDVAKIVGYSTTTLVLPIDVLTASLGAGTSLPQEALALGTRDALKKLLPSRPCLALAECLLTLARSMRTYQDAIGATDAVALAVRVMRQIGHGRGLGRALLDLGANLKDHVLLYDALRAFELADEQFEMNDDPGGLAASAFHRATVCRRLQEGSASLAFLRDAKRILPAVDAARGWIRQLRLEELEVCMDLDLRTEAGACIDEWLRDEQAADEPEPVQYLCMPLAARGELARRDGDLKSALASFSAAAALAADDILRHRTVRFRTYERANTDHIFVAAARCAMEAGAADLCFGILQLARTGSLSLSVRRGAVVDEEGGAQQERQEVARLVQRCVVALRGGQALGGIEQEVQWLMGRRDFVHGQSPSSVVVARDRDGVEALARHVRSHLGDLTCLLEYAWVGDGLVALVLDRDCATVHQFGIARADVARLVAALQQEMADPDGTCDALAALARAVLQPLGERLAAYSALFIVPAEGLHNVPFHALPLGNEPLIETHLVRYLDRAAVLAESRPRAASPIAADSHCCLLGASSAPYSQLPSLGGVGIELASVAAKLGGAPAATPSAVAAELFTGAQAPVLHVACHAEFEADAPMLSRLLFADRPIFAFEIALSSFVADLVVLSACDTASGPASKGGRVESLASAFLGAGARQVAATLWPLDDHVATLFVDRFYAQIVESGASAAVAARTAQRSIRAISEFRHPYYWAPFVVYGGV